MQRSMRATVGACVMAAASILSLGATAHAAPADAASTEDSAVAAAGWVRRGPFSTRAECERVRNHLASLGYATQPCRYVVCDTAPCISGWYYYIWK